MLNYNKINILLNDRNISKDNFYIKIDMTASGFIKMMENKRMKVETLEKIAAFFDKPISWFFDEYPPGDSTVSEPEAEYGIKQKYVELLEKYNKLSDEYREYIREQDKSKVINSSHIHKP